MADEVAFETMWPAAARVLYRVFCVSKRIWSHISTGRGGAAWGCEVMILFFVCLKEQVDTLSRHPSLRVRQ